MQVQWHDIIFLFLPGLIAIVVRPTWSSQAKFLLAFGVCVLGALAEVWLSGNLSLADLPGTVAKVFVLVMGSYAGLWKRFQVSDWLETNINPGD